MIDILMENNMTGTCSLKSQFINTDPCKALPFDILINCILPCRKTLPTLLRVSKHWNQILSNDRIWRLLLHLRLEKESNWLIEMGVANAAPNPRALYKELAFLSNEYHYPIQLILTSLTSSSFDSPRQTIKKTTELDPFSFWSSTGTDTDDTDEFLDYQLVHYTSMITSIHIKSFLAQYQRGLPYYAPKEISFSIAFTKFHKPHYISKRYPVKDSPDVQVFPLDNIVIGGYIKLHLHGKYNTQSSDGKYYTAIESVLIMGVPTTNLNKYPELSTTYSNWFDLIQLDQSILNNQFHHPELLVHEALVENEQLDMDMSVIGISEISSEFLSVNNEHEFEEMEMSNLEKQSKINGRVQRLLDTRHRENSALEYCKHLFDTLDYMQAFDFIIEFPQDSIVRTKPMLSILKESCDRHDPLKFQSVYPVYIGLLFDRLVHLNRDEALLLADVMISNNDFQLLERGIRSALIDCTLELGRKFDMPNRPDLLKQAFFVYSDGRSIDNILDCSFRMEQYRIALEVVITSYLPNEMEVLLPKIIKSYSYKVCSRFAQFMLRFLLQHQLEPWDIQQFSQQALSALGLNDQLNATNSPLELLHQASE